MRWNDPHRKPHHRLGKTDFLILDDLSPIPLGNREPRDPLGLVEHRVGRHATLVTCRLSAEHWHELVGDATLG